MLFIPCRGGVSHRPDEYASPEAIEGGTTVLAATLAALASAGMSAPAFPAPARTHRPIAAPAPGQPEPLAREPAVSRWLALPGFAILVGCLEVGRTGQGEARHWSCRGTSSGCSCC